MRAPGPRLPAAAAAAPARSRPAPLRSGAVAVAEHAWGGGGGGGGTVPQAAPPAAAPPVRAPHRHRPLRCWGPGCRGGGRGNLASSPRRRPQPGDPTARGPHPHPHLPVVRSSPRETPNTASGCGYGSCPAQAPSAPGTCYTGVRGGTWPAAPRPLARAPWCRPLGGGDSDTEPVPLLPGDGDVRFLAGHHRGATGAAPLPAAPRGCQPEGRGRAGPPLPPRRGRGGLLLSPRPGGGWGGENVPVSLPAVLPLLPGSGFV